jgi:nucleoside-diphosphate-sugar epimerase
LRVFLAGATGVLGRALLPRLVAAGHEVTGMTRSEQRAAAVRQAGAEPLVCDVFDEERLRAALAAVRPEVVIHELTALPERINYRKRSHFEPTIRLRSEGTRVLLAGAVAAGARRMLVQSIAFVQDPPGPGLVGEQSRTVLEMERAVSGSSELEGLALRYGFLYGPGTVYGEHGSTAKDFRSRRHPVVGSGDGEFPFVHVFDAADATVAAVSRGGPGVYEIVDDEPAPMREWVPAYAEAIGAPRPLRVPVWLARLIAGKGAAQGAVRMQARSNARAKEELGWEPRWPSWREGFSAAPR